VDSGVLGNSRGTEIFSGLAGISDPLCQEVKRSYGEYSVCADVRTKKLDIR